MLKKKNQQIDNKQSAVLDWKMLQVSLHLRYWKAG